MNKAGLVAELAKRMELPKNESRKVVDLFFDTLTDGIASDDRVEVRGLCTFKVKQYKGYKSRNPRTGEPIVAKPKKLPCFKCGKELKERVDYR